MKKILAFLLLIIVALAAFTPCCTDDCQDVDIAASQQDHSKAVDGDGCSPFFACTGCPGFTLLEKPIDVPAPTEYRPQFFVANFDFISSAYAISPWQPPRVV